MLAIYVNKIYVTNIIISFLPLEMKIAGSCNAMGIDCQISFYLDLEDQAFDTE